jgi:hypothetical protein
LAVGNYDKHNEYLDACIKEFNSLKDDFQFAYCLEKYLVTVNENTFNKKTFEAVYHLVLISECDKSYEINYIRTFRAVELLIRQYYLITDKSQINDMLNTIITLCEKSINLFSSLTVKSSDFLKVDGKMALATYCIGLLL